MPTNYLEGKGHRRLVELQTQCLESKVRHFVTVRIIYVSSEFVCLELGSDYDGQKETLILVEDLNSFLDLAIVSDLSYIFKIEN